MQVDTWAEEFGRRLTIARKVAGLTLAECAEQVGCNLNSLHRYERGKQLPSAERLAILARIYAASADDLLGLTAT